MTEIVKETKDEVIIGDIELRRSGLFDAYQSRAVYGIAFKFKNMDFGLIYKREKNRLVFYVHNCPNGKDETVSPGDFKELFGDDVKDGSLFGYGTCYCPIFSIIFEDEDESY